jgi:CBS domain containing-hemolysin-like protein
MEMIMKNLNMMPLDTVDHLVHPEEFSEITLASSALKIFTDFKQHQPLVIEGDTPAIQAEFLMRKSHVRLKLVVDKNDELIGTISLQELTEQNFIKHLEKGKSREDILVSEMMRPRSDIMALDYGQLLNSTIEDVVHTLQRNHQQHCLVLEPGAHFIRGIVSASDIARRLHMPLVIERAPTFVDIFEAVKP